MNEGSPGTPLAVRLLRRETALCRCCDAELQASEVLVKDQARRNPDDPEDIRHGRTAQVTVRCPSCIEETTKDLLL